MKIPPNMTEDEVVAVMQKIARAAKHKYRFGYYEADDIEQEAYFEAIKGLEKYDGKRPLENFLRVHVLNRLKNLKRNKYERRDKPCGSCLLATYCKKTEECSEFEDKTECSIYYKWYERNTAKKNLMNPVGIGVIKDHEEEHMRYDDDILDSLIIGEMLEIIEGNLTNGELRKDWIKLKHGLKVPKHRRQRIRDEVTRILRENGIDEYEA